ncbi:hypothetical protein [Agromyces laixinhei]|uniref:hypothetical protein n=1 Tax=Agromyces laixinhei TaxID=2585717 RepID=UPI0012ED5625|nr:hypothetical protein [Agromyces laixinhei]
MHTNRKGATSEPTSNASDDGLNRCGFRRRADGRDADGVPAGTAGDSRVGATAPIGIDEATSFGEVTGDCGTSFISFSDYNTIRTGYYILPSRGAPISHDWTVNTSSSIDLEIHDLSGLAPWGYQSWQATRDISTQYLPGSTVSALAFGDVLTTNGICYSGRPTATIRP